MIVKLNTVYSLALALALATSVTLVRAVESKCPDDLLHHGDLIVAKGASIEVPGPIKMIENGENGPKTSNIFESPDKETAISLCGDPNGDVRAPVDFVARWYAGDRLKKGSFPTVTLFCAAKFGGDAPPGIEYPDVVSAGNDAIKVACYREDRSAFLKLPKYYSLEVTNGTSYSLSKVGPFGIEPIEEGKPDTRDHRGFLWPSGPLNESWFNVYQYVDDPATAQMENWQDLYPVKKRVCVLRGEPLAFNMLPTVNVTASAVNITIGESDKATIQAECVDKDPKIACPATMNSVVTLTVAGNSRIRPLRNDTTNKVVDMWGKDLSVAFEAPCTEPIQVLVDMIPANQTLPGLGLQGKWNNSITVTRRTLCTYSGFSVHKKAHVHFGKGSAEANHNMGPTEWWECKDREVETIQQLQSRVKPSSSSAHGGGTRAGSSRGGIGNGYINGNTNGNTNGNNGSGSSNDNGGTSNGSSGSSGSNGGGNSGDTTHQQQQGQQSQQGGSNSQGGEEARGGSGGGSGRENPFN